MIYNEIDPFAAQWLENLVDARQIAKGQVITKSIAELTKEDLSEAKQVHLFAGIGGWPLALKLAGWPEDKPVWTGSCPCQPFSVAGKKKGNNDERHLWPEMFRLIKECKPPVIFGEQVASPDGIDWMQSVQNDLEKAGYEVGKLDLCAAGIGAPHIRQRIFWVAHRNDEHEKSARNNEGYTDIGGIGPTGGLAHCSNEGLQERDLLRGIFGEMESKNEWKNAVMGCWSNNEWLMCRDNKIRPTQPGLFPLAHGLPRSLGEGSTREQRLVLSTAKRSRVCQLKGYGNAIVPQLAAIFIRSVMEWIGLKEVEECK